MRKQLKNIGHYRGKVMQTATPEPRPTVDIIPPPEGWEEEVVEDWEHYKQWINKL